VAGPSGPGPAGGAAWGWGMGVSGRAGAAVRSLAAAPAGKSVPAAQDPSHSGRTKAAAAAVARFVALRLIAIPAPQFCPERSVN
jgi:hypothetical protein